MIYDNPHELVKHAAKIARHYPYFAVGTIPEEKPRETVDAKLSALYLTELTRAERQRRRRRGASNATYLRCLDTWALLVTRGTGTIWQAELLRSLQETPLTVFGYSLRLRSRGGGTFEVEVRISSPVWNGLRELILHNALRASESSVEALFVREVGNYTLTPFRGSTGQLRALFDEINRRRTSAGLKRISKSVLRVGVKR